MIKPGYTIMMASACAFAATFGLGLGMPLFAEPSAPAQATVMASYVEQQQAQQNGDIGPAGNPILPAPDGLYYLDAQFADGGRARFLIDTGASVTVLTGADARRLGVQPTEGAGGAKLRTAGGMTTARSATIARMDIAGRQLRNIRVAIIDNGLPVSLLGQNALAELGTITLGNGRMTID
ncbi:retropepsin-like aspartic protease family protein [Sphingobium fluviale]|uniref:TIGR02281 family clan AA aspartic protease n=1 Tax=Sphingobium fluviale TaxID=2506423 RepID=A0A4Q1KJZ4_9SPHN|nr:retropepsin-like aspartic protease [Sphingobium fluviale]RXR29962.1 TIGR02281 family clan AA aspartic protease [Sphingobium fluviale]